MDTTVNVNKVDLVYIPMWELNYTIDGKDYRALVDGAKNEVLTAEYPVSKRAKITIFDVFLGIPAVIAGVLGFSGDGSGIARIVMFVLLAAILAYSLLKGLSGRN